jgi:hypothetical protein
MRVKDRVWNWRHCCSEIYSWESDWYSSAAIYQGEMNMLVSDGRVSRTSERAQGEVRANPFREKLPYVYTRNFWEADWLAKKKAPWEISMARK